jgi:adenosine kinase
MRAAQWHLPPSSTVFVGCVGQDEYGARLRTVATQDGLRVEYLEDPAAPTGTCACLITEGGAKRSLVANLGAANNYKIEHVKTQTMQTVLKDAKCVYISGFFLTVSPDTIMHVAEQAHQNGQVALCMNHEPNYRLSV